MNLEETSAILLENFGDGGKKKKKQPAASADEEKYQKIIQQNKELASLLKKIQKPWASEGLIDLPGEDSQSGWLWKKRRNHPGWKRYFFSLNGAQLLEYKDDQRSRLKGAIGVAFISEKMPLTQDDLVRLNADNNSGDEQIRVSQNKFEVFTNHRVISFCAETNEQLDRWHQKIIQFLKENMSSSDFDVRSKAAQEAVPLLKAKSEAERENLYRILAILEANGIFVGTSLQAKDKGGKLEMEEENGIWTEYYFSLLRGCLYFKKDSRSPPKGFITLKNSDVEADVDNKPNVFNIKTSLATFTLRAKHKEAKDEWVKAVLTGQHEEDNKDKKKSKPKSPKGKGDEMEFTNLLAQEEPAAHDGWRRSIHFRTGPKRIRKSLPKQKFKLPKKAATIVIGRSSSTDLLLDDKKLSREHCKLESKDGQTWWFIDLGSTRGSKINKISATKHELKDGDKIKIGSTKITFRVKPPRGHRP